MRLVQVSVPRGKREEVLGYLDDEGIDYAVVNETGHERYVALVTFPLASPAVGPVLDHFRDVGLDEEAFAVVVDAETVVSTRFTESRTQQHSLAIAREELEARAEEMAPALSTFAILTIVSAVVATTGLLQNSAATIIGAMIIAPVMGPAVSAAVGTVVGNAALRRRAIGLQVGGLLLSVVSAAVLGVVFRSTFLLPPDTSVLAIPAIDQRLSPNLLSLVLAFGAGIAGAVSITRDVSSVLVGAMIAVALIPPAATVGLALAWGLPFAAATAGVLLLVNVLSINFTALVVLWLSGYRPGDWTLLSKARRDTMKRSAALALVLGVLTFALAIGSLASYGITVAEQDVNREVETLMDGPRYANLSLVDVSTEISLRTLVLSGMDSEREPTLIQITATVAPEDTAPSWVLADAIADRITERLGIGATVRVRYIDHSMTRAANASNGTGPPIDISVPSTADVSVR